MEGIDMFKYISSLFRPKSTKTANSEIPKPSKPHKDSQTLINESSFIYLRDGKTVYEERNGKILKGTPADKAEGQRTIAKVTEEVDALSKKAFDDLQENMNRMFDDMKKAFGPDLPHKRP
jgi:hypothetical protein